MKKLIESLESFQRSGKDIAESNIDLRRKWMSEFPSHKVKMALDDRYPWHGKDKLTDAEMAPLDKIYKDWSKYLKKIDAAVAKDPRLHDAAYLARRADATFKKLLKQKTKGLWVSLSAQIQDAENIYYQREEVSSKWVEQRVALDEED